jgi:hypothetical protein
MATQNGMSAETIKFVISEVNIAGVGTVAQTLIVPHATSIGDRVWQQWVDRFTILS